MSLKYIYIHAEWEISGEVNSKKYLKITPFILYHPRFQTVFKTSAHLF